MSLAIKLACSVLTWKKESITPQLDLWIRQLNFSELMKKYNDFSVSSIFSGKFMYDHKGFSIYNACIKIALVKTFQWLGVRVINMAVFSKYVWSFELFLFLFCHRTTDILAEKIRKPKDIITVALPFWFSWVFISSEN